MLLGGKDFELASAGVEEKADGEGEVFLLSEGFDGLGLVVVGYLAVGGSEVEDVAGSVADGEVGVDEAGGEVERGGLEIGGGLRRRGVGGGGWSVGRRSFLGSERGCGEERGEEEGRQCETHGVLRVSDLKRSEGDFGWDAGFAGVHPPTHDDEAVMGGAPWGLRASTGQNCGSLHYARHGAVLLRSR